MKDSSDSGNPSEKLLAKGAETLSNSELIAVILACGSRNGHFRHISKSIETLLEARKNEVPAFELISSLHGISVSKAAMLSAAFELGRRIYSENEKPFIRTPADLLPLLKEYAEKQQEHFLTVTLDGSKRLIDIHLTFIGTLNYSVFHPREVFASAFTDRAASIIVAHNHPSGDTIPSDYDILITKKLREIGHFIGIELDDHIIFTKKNGFYSFRENSRSGRGLSFPLPEDEGSVYPAESEVV